MEKSTEINGFIIPSWKMLEKIDCRKYMDYKNMDLFHLYHSYLEAYRPVRKYFCLCGTLSSKGDAKFSVVHFCSLIDNTTCFCFRRFLSSTSDVRKLLQYYNIHNDINNWQLYLICNDSLLKFFESKMLNIPDFFIFSLIYFYNKFISITCKSPSKIF